MLSGCSMTLKLHAFEHFSILAIIPAGAPSSDLQVYNKSPLQKLPLNCLNPVSKSFISNPGTYVFEVVLQ